MALMIEVLSWLLLGAGSLTLIAAATVILRMPTFYTRMHAASVNETLSPGLILSGLALQAGGNVEIILKAGPDLGFLGVDRSGIGTCLSQGRARQRHSARGDAAAGRGGAVITYLIDVLLFAFLVVTAWGVLRLRDLFAAAMMASLFSLLSACLFMVMDAADVAITEAAVGAGISTILMLATLAITKRVEKERKRQIRPGPLLLVLLTGAMLIYGTLDMPHFGDPDAPVHTYLAPRYLQLSPLEVGPPNFVTSVLASYRGYDTFGETTVIFAAAVGVLLLLGGRRRDRNTDWDMTMGVDLREVQGNRGSATGSPG